MQYKTQHLTPEQIARCAEAINSSSYVQLPEDWRNHLRECDQCAEEVINVAEISSDSEDISIPFRNQDTPQVPKTLRGTDTKVIFGIAAAAAVIAFALVLNIPWNDSNEIQQINKNQKLAKSNEQVLTDSTSGTKEAQKVEENEDKAIANTETPTTKKKVKKAPDNKLLAYYEPNPKLERMYKNMQGGYRGEAITIITQPELQYQKGTVLKWKNPERKTLYVELFNNEGEEVRRKITTENHYELPKLNPGLYYWKLIGEDFDLLFVGKIIVK